MAEPKRDILTATDLTWSEFSQLLRLVVGLRVGRVWPHAGCLIIWGWHRGQHLWHDR